MPRTSNCAPTARWLRNLEAAAIAMNHNPHFYADDSVLETGMHSNVALDHLTGAITTAD